MKYKHWIYLAFFNLLIVALLGLTLRYKMTYPLPIVNQKFLQHGHSHFALTGWVTQILMVYVSYHVASFIHHNHFKKYQWLLWGNAVSAYGMLFSFPIQGYAAVSIISSTAAVLISFVFAFYIWRDINRSGIRHPMFKWFKASTLFSVLSAVGLGWMVYLMITKNINGNYRLASLYLFLHMQYNGWFLFTCFGLLVKQLKDAGLYHKNWVWFFWAGIFCSIPTYFFSVPWLKVPLGLKTWIITAAVLQVIAWFTILTKEKKSLQKLFSTVPKIARTLIFLSAFAYSIKVFLQLGSVVPSLGKIVFGYRSIIIGYLHLVFLGVITLFVLGYAFGWGIKKILPVSRIGIITFFSGVILSELALMVQGFFALSYIKVPYIREVLIAVTAGMFIGALFLNIGLYQQKKENKP